MNVDDLQTSSSNEPGSGNIADSAHQQARLMARNHVVGQNERRVDARPFVTGSPVYAAEFEQPNMLHGRILTFTTRPCKHHAHRQKQSAGITWRARDSNI